MFQAMEKVVSATLLAVSRTSSVLRLRLLLPCVSLVRTSNITLDADNHADGVLAFATISLALKVPRMTDPNTQKIAVFVWGAIILVMYSFLLSVFRIKNGGYPFWLPPFW